MSITIKNFKSYLDSGPIEIKPITFVFGRNSSGKSALLQALNLLGQLEDKLFLPPAFQRKAIQRFVKEADISSRLSTSSDLSFTAENLHLNSFQQSVFDKNIKSQMEFVINRTTTAGPDGIQVPYELHISFSDPGVLTSVSVRFKEIDLLLFIYELQGGPSDEFIAYLESWPDTTELKLTDVQLDAHRVTQVITPKDDALVDKNDSWFEIDTKSLKTISKKLKENGIQEFIEADLDKKYLIPCLKGPYTYRGRDDSGKIRVESHALSTRPRWALEESLDELSEDKQLEHITDYFKKTLLPNVVGLIIYDALRMFANRSTCSHIPPVRGDPFISTIQNGTYNPLMNELLNSPSLRKRITSDLQSLGLKYGLMVKKFKQPIGDDALYLFLQDLSNVKPLRLSLDDVGFGVSQVLPILIKNVLEDSASTILLEEPESHLHPMMQGDLIETIAKEEVSRRRNRKGNRKKGSNPRYWVIETHSEYMLRRMQKLIRAKKFPSSAINVLFCDQKHGVTSVQQIRIGKTGELLDPWPNDFLESSLD